VSRVAIIGGGAAALRACLAAVEAGARVTLVSKGRMAASGCTLAVDSKIEFSVVNWPMPVPDTPSTYADDLETIGRGLKDPGRVRLFAERSHDESILLERLGVALDEGGGYQRVQLAGSSQPRGIVCPHHFGARLLKALWAATRQDRVTVLDRAMALEILMDGGRAAGVLAVDLHTGRRRLVKADAVVLAAGGAGQVFSLTTNPRELTGDGYALAARAGATLGHVEFIQYVMLTVAPIRGFFLLTSALLSGALVDEGGLRWTPGVDPTAMSPAEQKRLLMDFIAWIVQRKRSAPGIRVFWDGTALGGELVRRMPKTCAAFARRNCDLTRRAVEIDVGAHQFLGGVVTDLDARSTVPNLFAAGDVADSVQGADRINGSGLMEALVFGARAGAGAAALPFVRARADVPAAYRQRSRHPMPRLAEWRRRLASVMDEILVVRDRDRLTRLAPMLEGNLRELEEGGLAGETPATTRALHELRSALTTALAVTHASLLRERSLGLFQTAPGS
jgi:L-aspartate oxidase